MLKYIKGIGGSGLNRVIRGNIAPLEIRISDAELSARLSAPSSANDPKIKEVIEGVLSVCEVKFVATFLDILKNEDGEVFFDGFSVRSLALSKYFAESPRTVLFVITLGSAVDRLIMKKKSISLSLGFLYDAVASAIAEGACDTLHARLCEDEMRQNRFSPGYADCPLTLQRQIFDLLSADKYIGVKLLDSCLMSPMKSVSAFIALPI